MSAWSASRSPSRFRWMAKGTDRYEARIAQSACRLWVDRSGPIGWSEIWCRAAEILRLDGEGTTEQVAMRALNTHEATRQAADGRASPTARLGTSRAIVGGAVCIRKYRRSFARQQIGVPVHAVAARHSLSAPRVVIDRPRRKYRPLNLLYYPKNRGKYDSVRIFLNADITWILLMDHATRLSLTSPMVQYGQPRDRRSGLRFPIEAELSYLLLNGMTTISSGRGKTLNISSGGVLFQSTHPVCPGTQIELSIAWAARLDGMVRMQLWASGLTIWEHGNVIGVRILRHEFRTAGIHHPSLSEPSITTPPLRRTDPL